MKVVVGRTHVATEDAALGTLIQAAPVLTVRTAIGLLAALGAARQVTGLATQVIPSTAVAQALMAWQQAASDAAVEGSRCILHCK